MKLTVTGNTSAAGLAELRQLLGSRGIVSSDLKPLAEPGTLPQAYTRKFVVGRDNAVVCQITLEYTDDTSTPWSYTLEMDSTVIDLEQFINPFHASQHLSSAHLALMSR